MSILVRSPGWITSNASCQTSWRATILLPGGRLLSARIWTFKASWFEQASDVIYGVFDVLDVPTVSVDILIVGHAPRLSGDYPPA